MVKVSPKHSKAKTKTSLLHSTSKHLVKELKNVTRCVCYNPFVLIKLCVIMMLVQKGLFKQQCSVKLFTFLGWGDIVLTYKLFNDEYGVFL